MSDLDLEAVERATLTLRILAEGVRRAPMQWPEPVSELAASMRPVDPPDVVAFCSALAKDDRWRTFAGAVERAGELVNGVARAAKLGGSK
jgi:hypothetical protein